MVTGPRLKIEWEDGQLDGEKMAHASVFDVSGAFSHSSKVTRAIRNVHDQAETFSRQPVEVHQTFLRFCPTWTKQ